MLFKYIPQVCAVPGLYYSYGGVICQYKGELKGSCEQVRGVLGVNMGGETHTDRRGFKYYGWKHYTLGFEAGNNPHSMPMTAPHGIPDKHDQTLYETMVTSEGGNYRRCTSFTKVPVEYDGFYALNIKTFEPTTVSLNSTSRRSFNVRLNNITVLKELDVWGVHRALNKATEFIVYFEIETVTGGQILKVEGEDVRPPVIDRKVKIGFCNSDCGHPGGIAISAFSVVQVCDTRGEKALCRLAGADFHACRKYQFCRYDVEDSKCLHKIDFCTDKTAPTGRHCSHAGSWYSHKGAVCLVPINTITKCDFMGITEAWNVGGGQVIGSGGITFSPGPPSIWIKEENPLSDDVPTGTVDVTGVLPDDEPMYETYLSLPPGGGVDGICVKHKIPLPYDATYQLRLFMVEPEYKEPGRRVNIYTYYFGKILFLSRMI